MNKANLSELDLIKADLCHADLTRERLYQELSRLTKETIASLIDWDFILDALFVANI